MVEQHHMVEMPFLERILQKQIDQRPMRRYLAKNIVASGLSEKCLIQLSYAIGISKPLSIFLKLSDKDENKEEEVKKIIKKNFDLSPRGIREMLGLNKPIYEITSAYGHFGRKPTDKGQFSWEKTDKKSLFQL